MAERPELTFHYFPPVPSFTLKSSDVVDGAAWSMKHVADSMGYTGENLSPQLSWSGFPDNTQSFAVTIHDPDAPTGSGFWHWCVADIPASITDLPTGAGSVSSRLLASPSVTLANDAGIRGFMGAAPPRGDEAHRYVITVHAVDVDSLGLSGNETPAIVGFNLRFHGIARAQIVPVFGA